MNAAAILLLAEKGLSAHDIAQLAAILETPKDRTAAERQARHREKVKAERDIVTRDVTRDAVTQAPSPQSPPLKVSPDPFKNTPPLTPQPETKRARRLRDDWKPQPLTGKALEMVEQWQSGEIEREIAKFRNHWTSKAGKDACKLDWQKTFINWLISADERKPRNGHGQPSLRGTRPDPALELLKLAEREMRAEREAQGDHRQPWIALSSSGQH